MPRYSKRSRRPRTYKPKKRFVRRKRIFRKKVESKYIDAAAYNAVVVDTGNAISIPFAPAQGDDFNARQGREIIARGLQLRGTITMASAATVSTVRLILVQDKWNSGTATTLADFNNDTTINSMRILSPNLFRRYKILMDKTYSMDDSKKQIQNINIYKKFYTKIRFTGTAANSYGSNAMFLLATSSETTAGGVAPTLVLNTRSRYTE